MTCMGSSRKGPRQHLRPYDRHKKLINDYKQFFVAKSKPKTEYDVVRENHRFVRVDEDEQELSWEQRVAKKYYDKLFKEYAICELKYYRENKIALRWRTEREVVAGKGQFLCASTQCESTEALQSWEVNFGYMEDGEKKNELVKVRLCPSCSEKLNYKTLKRLAKRVEKAKKRKHRISNKDDKKKRRTRVSDDDQHSSGKDSDSSVEDDNNDTSQDESDIREDRPENDDTGNIWSRPLERKEEKTREEEYEDYFADLLM